MTTAQVVETSVTVNNSPIQDYVHPDDQTQPTRKASFVWELSIPELISSSSASCRAERTVVSNLFTLASAIFNFEKAY